MKTKLIFLFVILSQLCLSQIQQSTVTFQKKLKLQRSLTITLPALCIIKFSDGTKQRGFILSTHDSLLTFAKYHKIDRAARKKIRTLNMNQQGDWMKDVAKIYAEGYSDTLQMLFSSLREMKVSLSYVKPRPFGLYVYPLAYIAVGYFGGAMLGDNLPKSNGKVTNLVIDFAYLGIVSYTFYYLANEHITPVKWQIKK